MESCYKFKFDIRTILWRYKASYLGLILHRKINFKYQLSYVILKAQASLCRLLTLLGVQSDFSLINKLRLYKSIIKHQMTSTCPSWTFALCKTNLYGLQTIQNKSQRICTRALHYVKNYRKRDCHSAFIFFRLKLL